MEQKINLFLSQNVQEEETEAGLCRPNNYLATSLARLLLLGMLLHQPSFVATVVD